MTFHCAQNIKPRCVENASRTGKTIPENGAEKNTCFSFQTLGTCERKESLVN